MWRLKGCKRCGGDVFIDKDKYSWYQECLQCGQRTDLPGVAESKKQSATPQRKVVLAGSK